MYMLKIGSVDTALLQIFHKLETMLIYTPFPASFTFWEIKKKQPAGQFSVPLLKLFYKIACMNNACQEVHDNLDINIGLNQSNIKNHQCN